MATLKGSPYDPNRWCRATLLGSPLYRRVHPRVGAQLPAELVVSSKPRRFHRPTRIDELLDDGVVVRARIVNRALAPPVERPAEGSRVEAVVAHVDGRPPFQEQFDRVDVAAGRGAMQAGLPVILQLRGDMHPALQQEFHDIGFSEPARPREAVSHLLVRRRFLQRAVRVEEALDDVETADAGGAFEIEV